jgi:hypothetical protein
MVATLFFQPVTTMLRRILVLTQRVVGTLREEASLPRYQIPVLPPDGLDHDYVTIVTCCTVIEADRVVKKLHRAGITASIPSKFKFVTAEVSDLRNSYPHIPVVVSRNAYVAARQLLMLA